MFLNHLRLQHFRSYKKSEIAFSQNTTLLAGPNTSGKTNVLEAIILLSRGKSFRADKEIELIKHGEDFTRVTGKTKETDLEVVLSKDPLDSRFSKKYLLNGVPKRRADFAGTLSAVLFWPSDLDMIVGSPTLRRNFLDEVLEASDRQYRQAIIEYMKALRQRNALLERAKDTGERSLKQFEYWDSVLLKQGEYITGKREELITFFNNSQKEVFDFAVTYDKSVISKERLLQYEKEESASGVTLVGPHRDDFFVSLFDNALQTTHNAKLFGSRGQQRLVVLQLKILQLLYVENSLSERPILLLDDIFSELDDENINLVLEIIDKQQTIITSTHEDILKKKLKDIEIVELKK